MIPQGGGKRDHLSRVCAVLSQEFAGRLDPEVIERVASDEVAAFEEARVGDFVPILAMRRGRLRLREWAHLVGSVHVRDEVRQEGRVL
jgi:hypothetical protein